MNWFLYGNGLRHERVKYIQQCIRMNNELVSEKVIDQILIKTEKHAASLLAFFLADFYKRNRVFNFAFHLGNL